MNRQAFKRFAVRDLALLAGTLLGWVLFAKISIGQGLLANFVGATLGVAGGLCAWFAHEWGHVLAAWAAGSKLRAPNKLVSVYLFGFDNKTHTRGQFVAMSLGGFAATAGVYALIHFYLPQDWLATRVVHGLVLLEIAVTVALEVPGLLLGIFAYSKLPSVDVLGE
ncbi:MAG: hypothetical protein ABJG15_14550 [Hyphomonadaceae bacterium]